MKYAEYKKSLYPFDRMIPSHWEETYLSRAYSLKSITGHTDEDLLSVFLDKGVINYNESNKKQVHKPSEDMSKYQLVEPGDFVMNNQQAWRGSVGVSKYRGIISPAYYIWAPRNDYNPKYMNFMLRDKDIVDQFVLASKGVGSIQRQIYVPYMKTTVLAIPPHEEQDQIVRYLDWQLSKINKLIHGYQREIALIEEKKITFVFNAVTKGLSEEVNLRESDIYWLDRIPAHWVTTKFARVFTEVKCKNVDMKEKNLLSLSYGAIKQRDINATEGLLPESFEGYNIIEKDDIVLRLTDLQNDHKSLRTGIARERGIVTSAYTTLRNVSENESEYLQLFLHAFDLAKGFYNVGASGVRQSLGWDTIKTLNILIPPIDEQQKIVKAVYAEYDRASKAKESIEQEIALLKEYRTRLISDVVTGQMDVRGIEIPDYTPEDEIENDSSVDDDTIEDDNLEKEDDYNE